MVKKKKSRIHTKGTEGSYVNQREVVEKIVLIDAHGNFKIYKLL